MYAITLPRNKRSRCLSKIREESAVLQRIQLIVHLHRRLLTALITQLASHFCSTFHNSNLLNKLMGGQFSQESLNTLASKGSAIREYSQLRYEKTEP